MATDLPSLIRERRSDLRLRQTDIAYKTKLLGGSVTKLAVAHLENGRLHPSHLRPAQARALREVLAISAEEWTAHATPPLPRPGEVP